MVGIDSPITPDVPFFAHIAKSTGASTMARLAGFCFRKVAIDVLEKSGRDWEVLFTGISVHSVQAAVQAGMGFSVLPLGALSGGVRQVPLSYGFPPLPMHTLSLFTDDEHKVSAKELFIEYLEYEIRKKQHKSGNY
ncbi:MAG: hypothetical protein BA863_11295 [Desulfovibrio sp. S3730MH75]|nr:MAG: hypothetical protein BA863_11295 [Desulfovibrio sp. S3730MH75]